MYDCFFTLDAFRKLFTTPQDIQKETMNSYTDVLRYRHITRGLEGHTKEREELCNSRLEYTKTVKTPPWSTSDICKALKALKSRKSRDPTNLANEIFHPEVAGDDLIDAIKKVNEQNHDGRNYSRMPPTL